MNRAVKLSGLLLGVAALVIAARLPNTATGSAAADRPLELVVTDNFVFEPAELHCRAGSTVRLRLTFRPHSSGPDLMHTVAVLQRDTDVEAFAGAALNADATDAYVPAAFRTRVVAVTPLLHSGESAELSFTAPATAGTTDLVCTFPGHCLIGMRAKLIVD